MKNNYPWPYNLAFDIFGDNLKFDDILPRYLEVVARDDLSDREYKCVRLRYIDHKTYDEIGEEFKVTRERIRQILAKALRKLSQPTRVNKFLAVRRCDYNMVVQENIQLKRELEALDGRYYTDDYAKDHIFAFLDTPIDELELSVRSWNCIHRSGSFKTYRDFQNYKIANFMKIRNLGRKSLNEILDKLSQLGFEACDGDHIYDLHEWNGTDDAVLVWKGEKR